MRSVSSNFNNQSSLDGTEITRELAIRPRRPADLAAENRSIKLLVQQSADGPEHLFELLVDVVLELCHAGSAGVSLLEAPEDGEGEMVFRLAAVAGEYREHNWVRAPQHPSPCGVCLDRAGPMLLLHPDRRFPFLAEAQPLIVEALLVPLPAEHGPAGTLWITSHDEERKFDAEDMRIMSDLGGIAATGHQMSKALLMLETERMALRQTEAELEGHIKEKARLQALLEEKQVLLEEIHHQVKNNLNAISSLLSIQSGYLSDSETRRMFDEMQDRVRAIAGLHETLYSSQDLGSIEFGPYVEALAKGLFKSYASQPERIALRIESADLVLRTEQALPLGLIANELICNALKHAFPGDRRGLLEVSLKYVLESVESGQSLDEGWCELVVRDNGVGLQADFEDRGSMGMRLVRLLVHQLRGELRVNGPPEAMFTIRFPLKSH
jgi:two-component sensor histidine kinase